MAGEWKEYLKDPLLGRLYARIRAAGPLRSIVLDLTHKCNLRCKGCYFFAEDMDDSKAPQQEDEIELYLLRASLRERPIS